MTAVVERLSPYKHVILKDVGTCILTDSSSRLFSILYSDDANHMVTRNPKLDKHTLIGSAYKQILT